MCHAQDLPWYRTWFNEDYLEVYGHRDEAEAKQGVELAARGLFVVALDLSSALLRSGAQKARDEGVRVGFVQADARHVAVHSGFDAVVNFFTSFGYFEADEDNELVLENIARVLKKRGRFLIDYLNVNHLQANLVTQNVWRMGSASVREDRSIDTVNRRVNKTIAIEREGVEKRYFESVRLYSQNELTSLLSSCGLRVSRTFGDYDGSAVDVARPRLILVGERA